MNAFRREPTIILRLMDKINDVFSFWVNQLGWDSRILLTVPQVIGLSLTKSFIPRASVVKVLISKGLMTKNASLITPILVSENLFLEKFIKCFREEASQLLKVYQEKMNFEL